MTAVGRPLRRTTGALAAATLVLGLAIGESGADPAADALARLDELSRQAVQTRESVTAAQRDADAKLAEQTIALDRHRADLGALDAANLELAPRQAAFDRVAAMTYASGSTGQFTAALTAASPGELIDRLSLQTTVAARVADQIKAFRVARERANSAAEASRRSAAEAGAAAESAGRRRAELDARWRDLLRQVAAAEAQYAALTPSQQQVVAARPTVPPGDVATPPEAGPGEIPESLPVGVASEAGLQPNTILTARAVSAQFPQIAEIDGVRPDSKPWHPSGLAIDIMIPNPESPEGIALGDQIRAFAMSNSARFGIQDVIWRGTYSTPAGPQASGYGHYDHVHITTTPRN
ncbi:glycoside hydrolase [Mycobacterium yunnanensis]|uniref:Glycoside hydrolase n=1 Tax=Mycobacterium yunnanensis TaxID=368477 RepID=A0A9X2YZW1_9MYCO|nr:glycoside hydrolase [Mycobacterium yunnanensis]MCV7420444.1 glycoside hydrolase [Mycobacterium yunnanensis]